jgi:hypothetical protein
LKSGLDLVIDSLRMQYTTKGDSVSNADWQNRDVLPAELQGVELRLAQSSHNLIELPLTDIQNFKQIDYRDLSITPTLRAKETFKLQLEFPKGVSVPKVQGKSAFCRLEFRVTSAKIQ